MLILHFEDVFEALIAEYNFNFTDDSVNEIRENGYMKRNRGSNGKTKTGLSLNRYICIAEMPDGSGVLIEKITTKWPEFGRELEIIKNII